MIQQPKIAPQDARSYNKSLHSWLPNGAEEAAAAGNGTAIELMIVYRRYAAHKHIEDWPRFLELCKRFMAENGE